MTSFKDAAIKQKGKAKTRTTNGMKARVTSASSIVDLFNVIGSSRGSVVAGPFAAALAHDEEKAVRILLWARDILEGAGERQQFRSLLKVLEKYDYKLAGKLIPKIPELGRWDDLFSYENPENIAKAFDLYALALNSGDALAAKWAPREKSTKKKIAYQLRKHLGLKPKEYRKLLVSNTDVVENKMCAQDWKNINFSHVPSIAAFRYQKAFGKHSPSKYSLYLNALETGGVIDGEKVKVNSKALYPHDVIMSILKGHDSVAYAQWEAMPDFTNDARILPLVDVSGSMGYLGYNHSLDPIHVAVSLGLYLSEKNTSAFKDVFITFSSNPKIEVLKGNLKLKLQQLSRAEWGMSTDLHKAFDAILDLAVASKLKEKDMPEYLLILSDMQFNHCIDYDDSAIQMIKRKYTKAGYEVPKIIFWNLSRHTTNTTVKFDKNNTAMISGFSPSIMKSVLSADLESFTPENVMLETIMSERYNYLD